MSRSSRMPALFLGHGSPLNAIEENEFVEGFRNISSGIRKPVAIICISAHWETKGTSVTAMSNPRTIHDFSGFPQELYRIQYNAPGSPALASQVKDLIRVSDILLDNTWGLDHGAWSVIKHLYPKAEVPVIQLSLDYTKPALYHYNLGAELASLRGKGILIIGSGNIVHNLSLVAWDKLNDEAYGFDWAIEANERIKKYFLNGDYKSLVDYELEGKSFQLAIPTPEHFLPLLYILALKNKDDETVIFNDKPVGGSLTMTSFKIGT